MVTPKPRINVKKRAQEPVVLKRSYQISRTPERLMFDNLGNARNSEDFI